MPSLRFPLRHASLLLVAIVSACGGSSGGYSTGPAGGTRNPSTATVAATPALAFDPGTVTIASGGTVTWDIGSVSHSVVFERTVAGGRDANGYYTGTGDSAPSDIAAAQATTVSRTFSTAGSYAYHCSLHDGMTGTIVVR